MSGRADFHPARVVRLVPLALSLFLLAILLAGSFRAGRSAHAQDQGAGALSQKEVQELLDDLDDIDTMHALQPLKVTPDQADRLVTVISAAKADYDKKILALGGSPILKMADEIRTTRRQVLAGKEIPKDFDDRVKKIQQDFYAQRKKLNDQNILRMSTEARNILTPQQIATAAKLEKSTLQKLGRYNPDTTDSQLFNQYVVDIFIYYPRILPLLKEMKAVNTGEGGGK
jgi:hypothetical protein